MLVEKKDHSTRFCINYRALNEITPKNSHPLPNPLPNIQDCIDALVGTTLFSSIYLRSGYWQFDMSSADAPKTAFTCSEGLVQFKVLPLGCCNGRPTFQCLIDYVLLILRWELCLLHLDDVDQLGQVFTHLSDAGLKVAP